MGKNPGFCFADEVARKEPLKTQFGINKRCARNPRQLSRQRKKQNIKERCQSSKKCPGLPPQHPNTAKAPDFNKADTHTARSARQPSFPLGSTLVASFSTTRSDPLWIKARLYLTVARVSGLNSRPAADSAGSHWTPASIAPVSHPAQTPSGPSGEHSAVEAARTAQQEHSVGSHMLTFAP